MANKVLSLGGKIREFRMANKLTLQQVAEGAGCTAAYISQIEHDKASPSIASLKRIAQVMGVRIVDFFLEEGLDDPVVLAPEKWPKVSLPRWRADIKQMVRGVKNRKMQPFHTVIQPGGGTHDSYYHQGEEFGLVLEGELTLTVGGDIYTVKAGSSFYYTSTMPHSWTNERDIPCRVIWVVTPPSW